MSALTDLFTSMANKIRSKTGGSDTYTPAEMASDGIDDVYAAGAASVPSPTSITPSNASPVALTANTAVKPTAAGYAIESYSDVTPSNVSPVSLTSGDIVKLGGNGKAVASITSITPSSSPNLIGLGGIYAPTREGYVVQNIRNISPSDSSPANLNSGDICKMNNAGVAIYSYQSYGAPSASGTPFNAGFTKWTSGGYAYPSRPVALPDFSNPDYESTQYIAKASSSSTPNTQSHQLTETPKFFILFQKNNGGSYLEYCTFGSFMDDKGMYLSVTGNASGDFSNSKSIQSNMISFNSSTNVLTIYNNSASYNRYVYLGVWY